MKSCSTTALPDTHRNVAFRMLREHPPPQELETTTVVTHGTALIKGAATLGATLKSALTYGEEVMIHTGQGRRMLR